MMDPSLFTGSHKHRFDENGYAKINIGIVWPLAITINVWHNVEKARVYQTGNAWAWYRPCS